MGIPMLCPTLALQSTITVLLQPNVQSPVIRSPELNIWPFCHASWWQLNTIQIEPQNLWNFQNSPRNCMWFCYVLFCSFLLSVSWCYESYVSSLSTSWTIFVTCWTLCSDAISHHPYVFLLFLLSLSMAPFLHLMQSSLQFFSLMLRI